MNGTLIKATDEDRFALFCAYSPNNIPARGADKKIDVASPRVIELGCWRFAVRGMKLGLGHQPGGEDIGTVVENSVYRGPDWTVKSPDGSLQRVRSGDWLVGIILSDRGWQMYKAGKISGVSLEGLASRKKAAPETLANKE